jgi:hypothetical protein
MYALSAIDALRLKKRLGEKPTPEEVVVVLSALIDMLHGRVPDNAGLLEHPYDDSQR